MSMTAKSKPHVTIEAVVKKADGTVVNYGTIADSSKGEIKASRKLLSILKGKVK